MFKTVDVEWSCFKNKKNNLRKFTPCVSVPHEQIFFNMKLNLIADFSKLWRQRKEHKFVGGQAAHASLASRSHHQALGVSQHKIYHLGSFAS